MKILLPILLIVLLFGCSSPDKNNAKPQEYKFINNDSKPDRYIETEKAKDIANKILQTGNIEKVVVVVSGKTALVGMTPNNDSKEDLKILKTTAAKKVREVDANISKIEVSTDDDIYDRISKLNDDITNGKPLKGITDSFKGILKNAK